MKLVLFDIDGTLTRSLKPIASLQRFRHAIKKVFRIDIGHITKPVWLQGAYNGRGDRYILWSLIKNKGITRDNFLDHLGYIESEFVRSLNRIRKNGQLYGAIPYAEKLVNEVINSESLRAGILTGNLAASADWKLNDAGYQKFSFNVTGSDSDERNNLAKLALVKAEYFFERKFDPSDVIIIGDTINDLNCARSIGAKVIIYSGGWNVDQNEINSARPDLLVDSLDDERVFQFLGIK